MEEIAIVGAGSFGTAIAIILTNNGHRLRLYVREPDTLNIIESWGMNQTYLPGYNLNLDNIYLTDNMLDAIKNVKYIFFTVPSQNIHEVITKLKFVINDKTIIVLTSKGMIDGFSVSEITQEILPYNKICGIYGITFAELIAGGEGFSSMCIASEDESIATEIAKLFISNNNSSHFRIYISKDLKGAEFGGAMKNVYAIAMGLYDGYLEFVQNNPKSKGKKIFLSRHSLLNLCIMEFIELGLANGVKLYTLLGPSGIGDIVACAGDPTKNSSRNYQYGRWNASLEFREYGEYQYKHAPTLHEGYDTVKSAKIMANRYKIETPILDAVHNILYNKDNKTNRKNRIQLIIPPLLEKLAIMVESKDEYKFYQQICNYI